MGAFLESCRSRRLIRLVPIALIASGLAACSSDLARFNDNALSNPYASRPPANSNVAAVQPAPAATPGPIDARPLPPPPGHSDITGMFASQASASCWRVAFKRRDRAIAVRRINSMPNRGFCAHASSTCIALIAMTWHGSRVTARAVIGCCVRIGLQPSNRPGPTV